MSKERLDPDYAAAAFALPVGGLKVVKSQFGYHVIKVTEKKNEGVSALEEVKEGLTEFFKEQKAQAELTKFVGDLRNQAKIEILIPAVSADIRNLPAVQKVAQAPRRLRRRGALHVDILEMPDIAARVACTAHGARNSCNPSWTRTDCGRSRRSGC